MLHNSIQVFVWFNTPYHRLLAWSNTPSLTSNAWSNTPYHRLLAWINTPSVSSIAWSYTPSLTSIVWFNTPYHRLLDCSNTSSLHTTCLVQFPILQTICLVQYQYLPGPVASIAWSNNPSLHTTCLVQSRVFLYYLLLCTTYNNRHFPAAWADTPSTQSHHLATSTQIHPSTHGDDGRLCRCIVVLGILK